MRKNSTRNFQRWLWLGLFLLVLPVEASAQMFSYGPDRPRAVQAVTFVYSPVSFNYNGDTPQADRYDFDSPAYGLRFARSGFDFTILYGKQGEGTLSTPEFSSQSQVSVEQTKLNYVAADLVLNGSFGLARRDENILFLPIGLYSGYRVVGENFRGNATGNEFNFTAIALGAGLGFSGELGSSFEVTGQALPSIGFASRSVQGLAGSVRTFYATIDGHLKEVFRNYGLSFGYAFTGQDWRINSDEFIEQVDDEVFDYTSSMHTFRIGVNF